MAIRILTDPSPARRRPKKPHLKRSGKIARCPKHHHPLSSLGTCPACKVEALEKKF